MSKYIYTGFFKNEMTGFIEMRKSQGFENRHRSTLESLDKFLAS